MKLATTAIILAVLGLAGCAAPAPSFGPMSTVRSQAADAACSSYSGSPNYFDCYSKEIVAPGSYVATPATIWGATSVSAPSSSASAAGSGPSAAGDKHNFIFGAPQPVVPQVYHPYCLPTSCYGDISTVTGLPRTHYVRGYYRKNGTYVRPYYRSRR